MPTPSTSVESDLHPAALMDGERLGRRPVHLLLHGDGLTILHPAADDRDEDVLFSELRLVEALPDRTVFTRAGRPDWRLVAQPALPAAFSGRVRKAGPGMARNALLYGGTAALILALGLFLWFRGGALVAAAAPLVPESVTVPLGETIVQTMTGGRICESAAAEAALARLTDRLLPDGSGAEPVRVQVADLAVANAFAAPGGQVVLTRGLIEQASGPDEVAGVLAHEFGHVAHRHATRMLLRNMGMSILLGGFSDAARMGDTLLANVMSREAEREADRFALDALAAANISPAGLAAFFERAGRAVASDQENAKSGRDLFATIGTWASTHPPSAERLATFRAAAEAAGETVPAMDASDWNALRAACETTGAGKALLEKL
ncbi:MAG: M48 family metallopeptidase [Sphingomonadaceae bacterium]